MVDHKNPQENRFGSKELRRMEVPEEERQKIKRNPVYIILDNVLDTYNIGAVFRLADAVSASKIYICGDSEIPPNHRIKKASINTTEWVPWQYCADAQTAISDIKSQVPNIQVIAVEQSEKSVPYTTIEYTFPLALVVGHETDGVSEETMRACDVIAEIPMWGVNKSLNVMVSLAIVLFKAMERLPEDLPLNPQV